MIYNRLIYFSLILANCKTRNTKLDFMEEIKQEWKNTILQIAIKQENIEICYECFRGYCDDSENTKYEYACADNYMSGSCDCYKYVCKDVCTFLCRKCEKNFSDAKIMSRIEIENVSLFTLFLLRDNIFICKDCKNNEICLPVYIWEGLPEEYINSRL